jgi:hypothetical protein
VTGVDLADFLRARLGEVEEVAREATPGPWRADCPDRLLGRAELRVGDEHLVSSYDDADLQWEAAHIVRHDPARVLRDVEAKRRILDEHAIRVKAIPITWIEIGGERPPPEHEVTCQTCGWASDDPTSGCSTLRLLALPYADHPDCREEWRP